MMPEACSLGAFMGLQAKQIGSLLQTVHFALDARITVLKQFPQIFNKITSKCSSACHPLKIFESSGDIALPIAAGAECTP